MKFCLALCKITFHPGIHVPGSYNSNRTHPSSHFSMVKCLLHCPTTSRRGAALFNPAFIISGTQLLLKSMPPCMGSWTWHSQTFLRASNQLWFYPLVTVPVIILKSEHSNFNNILLQVAVIMSSPFYAFYRLNQEWICDTRILLSLTGSECSWRRWKTTHHPLCWAMEAGDSPWLLLQNAEVTIHSKCTFLRTWFSFPCDCLHSLMLPFFFCWSFLRILNLVCNIQCHCNPTTWLCWHDKSVFLRNPKQPQSFISLYVKHLDQHQVSSSS